ncbi:NAD-dependent epimerase/dehydratase family protein [Draconibacterium halophilum]|uniref:NAD(P)-dependent oxidoreductase n=1 Tax=Draconibacterium halophilum TaxID=2706887 RepID=A0A6C0RHF1_9BACT|nr:NAD(P)-dependent oxidoreductase [Draconibacterium halophilum]QIA08521.1 NAD(P)-dependent oxidoreductase [Draconibacterium halophilum]
MKTVMVIGATGTLGTYFVDHLHEKGYNVWAVGRRNVNERYYSERGIKSVKVDITNKEDFKQLPDSGIDSVVLIAGAMPSRMIGYDPQKYIDVNVKGTLNVLEYCRNSNVQQLLFTQSHSDVAGYWNTGEYIKPDAPRKLVLKGDHAVYIITKNAAVDLIEHYHRDHGLRTFIFRLPTIYNYRPIFDMYVNGKSVPMGYRFFIQKAINSEPIEIWGDPNRAKDIVYVKDFNQMLNRAIDSDLDKGFYNVATGKPITLEDQIRGVVDVFSPEDKQSEIIYRPNKPSQNSYLYDITNAKKELGYQPEYSYREMLWNMKEEMKGSRFDHLKDLDVTI